MLPLPTEAGYHQMLCSGGRGRGCSGRNRGSAWVGSESPWLRCVTQSTCLHSSPHSISTFLQATQSVPLTVVLSYIIQDYTKAEHISRVKEHIDTFRQGRYVIDVLEGKFGVNYLYL